MIHLSAAHARSAIDGLSVLLLVSAVFLVLLHRLRASIVLLAVQGLLLTAVASVVAVSAHTWHHLVAVALTFAVKVVAIPALLLFALRGVRLKREVEMIVSHRLALLIALALCLVAYYVTAPLTALESRFPPNALPTAVAMLLIGLFAMLTYRKALSQVVALIVMENGLYLVALVATRGLPVAVELGIALDVLVGVTVMTLVSRQILVTFDTINTDPLRSLRG